MKAPQAISFDAPFIENVTKAIDPSYTATTLTSFNVYGTMENTNGDKANIFNRVTVTKNATTNQGANHATYGQWGYASENTQYWVAGNTYAFAAVAGDTASNNTYGVTVNVTTDTKMPSTITYDASSQTDLLYDYVNHGEHGTDSATEIAFTFDHLLSKVKFSFTSGYAANYKVEVTEVTITNPYKTGTCSIDNTDTSPYTWASQATAEDYTLSFAPVVLSTETSATASAAKIPYDEGESKYSSLYERLMIPADYTTNKLKVSVKANVYLNNGTTDLLVAQKDYSLEVAVNLQPGNSYNFVGDITGTLTPITFKVESTGTWTTQTTQTDQTITVQ